MKNGRKTIQNVRDEFGIGGEEGSSVLFLQNQVRLRGSWRGVEMTHFDLFLPFYTSALLVSHLSVYITASAEV